MCMGSGLLDSRCVLLSSFHVIILTFPAVELGRSRGCPTTGQRGRFGEMSRYTSSLARHLLVHSAPSRSSEVLLRCHSLDMGSASYAVIRDRTNVRYATTNGKGFRFSNVPLDYNPVGVLLELLHVNLLRFALHVLYLLDRCVAILWCGLRKRLCHSMRFRSSPLRH